MTEILYLLGIGLLATSFPEAFDKNTLTYEFIQPLEKRIELPYTKTLPALIGELGFEISQLGDLCLYPSFFLRMKPAFDAFFDENQVNLQF